MQGAPQDWRKNSYKFPESIVKVWNNLSYYLSTGKIHKYTVLPNCYLLLSGITVTQTSPIQRHFIWVRQPPSSPPAKKSYLWSSWTTHNKHHVPHSLPSLLPTLLFLYNYKCPTFLHCLRNTTLHVLEKDAQIVKHRGLQACPQGGCTVTHHSILWVGLFILHFPQLLCCSAVYSAQDIKPTAANQNRTRVKLSVVKLAREHDQGTWTDATGKISSFTIFEYYVTKYLLGSSYQIPMSSFLLIYPWKFCARSSTHWQLLLQNPVFHLLFKELCSGFAGSPCQQTEKSIKHLQKQGYSGIFLD